VKWIPPDGFVPWLIYKFVQSPNTELSTDFVDSWNRLVELETANLIPETDSRADPSAPVQYAMAIGNTLSDFPPEEFTILAFCEHQATALQYRWSAR
jgi:hypothetical protein